MSTDAEDLRLQAEFEAKLNAADPGNSPAQLREKVEALEKRIADVASVATSAAGLYDDVWTRLDAALKRIELLERDMGNVLVHPLSGAK